MLITGGGLKLKEVKISNFLLECKPFLKELISILSREYDYISILGTDTFGKKYSVNKTGVGYNDSNWNERGFVLRVYNGVNYSEYSFNQLNGEPAKLAEVIKEKINSDLNIIRTSKLKLIEYPLVREEEIRNSFNGKVQFLPDDISVKDSLKRISQIKDKALEASGYIVDFRVIYEEVQVSKVFLSNKKELEQSYIWSQGYQVAIVRKDGNTKYYYDVFSGLKGVELLKEMEAAYLDTVTTAEKLLEADRIIPGEYDIICSPDVAGLIAHEAFGHGVEMDMFVKNRAKAVEYLNKEVASGLVTMYDGAKSHNHVSSYLFDDEGIIGKNTIIIDKGILREGISDTLSALQMGLEPTGNGKRESYERKAYSRMTNTYFAAGNDNLEEMIASIEAGYLLDKGASGMEDPKNWGIQCMLLIGKEIKNGRLTGKIVSPVIMTGYVPDLLKNISMTGKEIELSGSGACGKGYKEFVKVSSGGPYLKTKARLG